jgi:transposase
MTLENVRFFERQIAFIDKAITRELAAFNQAQVLLSVPGLGPVSTAGIIAEVQDVNRFDSHASLARLASIVWKRSQSGAFEADDALRQQVSSLLFYGGCKLAKDAQRGICRLLPEQISRG